MENRVGRQSFRLALLSGALFLGMALGGLELMPVSHAEATQAVSGPIARLPSFADLVELVSPAVVWIRATTIGESSSPRGTDPFEFFPGQPHRQPQSPEQQPEKRNDSSGSGFVISADGYVVTNHHVIEDATELTVNLNGRQYKAEVKGDDPATDLALLKIEPDGKLTYLELADSDKVRVGDWLMVIGSPLQLTNSVSVGVVSAKGRSINITSDRSLENFIQTDAAINFGNSGGPLVDLSGAVIGIATAINFGAENIGFAVPSNTLRSILPQLYEHGSVRRGYLGVNITDLDFESAQAFGLDSPHGALVTEVLEDGPARKAGLRHGDVIVQVNDHRVSDNRALIEYAASRQPGDSVALKFIRNGQEMSVDVELDERPDANAVSEEEPEEQEEPGSGIEWLGIRYHDLTPTTRERQGIPNGIQGVRVTDVVPTSPLWDKNVRPGDFIIEVNGGPVASARELKETIDKVESNRFLRLYVTHLDPGRSPAVSSFFAIVRVP